MIQPILETSSLMAGQDQNLVIRLANSGPQVCRGIVFRVRLPAEIISLRGEERVDISELLPGAVCYLRLVVRPARPGSFLLASGNFHYRDSRDRPVTPSPWRQQVVVEAPRFTPEQQAAHEAERHARAQRWEAAWPLFMQARDGRQALACLQRSVQRLQAQRPGAGAAAQYLAFAQAARQVGDPGLANHPPVVRGLEQAIEWYLQAGDAAEAHRCRDLLGYLTQAPVLDLKLSAAGSAAFVAGVASLVTIEIANRGYGPAHHVRLRLDGAVERPDEWQCERLGAGQTAIWHDACVIPSHPGQCVVRVQAIVGRVGGQADSQVWYRAAIPVGQPDLLAQMGRQQTGALPLHIEKYFGAGATNFDTGVVYSPSRSRVEPGAPGRWDGVLDDAARRAPERCARCAAPVEGQAKYCAQCGAPLG